MLWDRISQFRELVSLFFCLGFSISSLVWNGSYAVKAVSNSRKIGNILSSSFQSMGNLFSSFTDRMESFETVKKERDEYLKKIEKYEYLLEEKVHLKEENDKLRSLLDFKPEVQYPIVKAKVLTVRLNTIYRTIIINKGSDAGIKAYMPVIARMPEDSSVRLAVVGKVISVAKDSAIIQPLVNSAFTMGVKFSGVNAWALLSGNSGKAFDVLLSYIDSRTLINPNSKEQNSGLVGKPVYSSGGSGIFPPDIPVGIISEEGNREGVFRTAFVKPFVQFGELEYVTIIKKLPEKWTEDWPQEKPIQIDDPVLAEPLYPEDGAEDSNLRPLTSPNIKKKKVEDKTKEKQPEKKKTDIRDEEDDEEDILMKNGSPQ